MTRAQIFQASTDAFRKALEMNLSVHEAEIVSFRVYSALVECCGMDEVSA